MLNQNNILNLDRDLTPNAWMKLSGKKYNDYLMILNEEKVRSEFVKQCLEISSRFTKGKSIKDLIMNLNPKTDYETHLCVMWRCMLLLDHTGQEIIYYNYMQPNKKQINNLISILKRSAFYRKREKTVSLTRENYFLILSR